MKNWFKENSSHLAVIALFLVLVFFYFSPVWQGKSLSQHDVEQAIGSQKEIFDYRAIDGHSPKWTNTMFGGMPTFQVWYEHTANITTYISNVISKAFPTPANIVLIFLLGAYFLLSVLKIKPWLAALGAIAIAFSSYNFIYIEAGHLNRALAIAYLAPVIGAILLSYRGSMIWGPILLALFLALEIRTNHVQMTYYLMLAMLIYVGFEFYYAIRDKKVASFLKISALQLGAVVLAVAVNATVLFPTYEYSKYSTRGKANLEKESTAKGSGLDKDYAFAWSQGVGENITMLIPYAYGGKSQGVLDEKSNVYKTLKEIVPPEYQQYIPNIMQSLPTYWGDKQFTSGAWYFGAGIIALFVLALVIVKDRYKWWIVSSIVLTMLLALGSNFPALSNFFFDYIPLYNKFRAPESILIIPSILIPLMAVLGVNELINNKEKIENLNKKVLYSFGGVAFVCLLIALTPSLLGFKASNHADLVAAISQNYGPSGSLIVDALIEDRSAIASADAWRSFFIVAIVFGLIWLYIKQKLNATVLVIVLGVVTLIDLWTVDKRYLNDQLFVRTSMQKNTIPMREVDQLIQMDKDLHYRVLDLTTNPFADTKASFHHKSLGGYHAAKLMRFQEILENQFNGAINEDVLDMFNVRYLIAQDPENKAERIQRRSTAAGNAWFVDKVTVVKDNNEEMQALGSFDPSKEAFVQKEFADKIDAKKLGGSANASIKLVSYHPDKMVYEYTAPNDVFAVFSEVYYEKGWKAYVDGAEVPIVRADYILRALQLPGGNHKVEFVFDPESMKISTMVSLVASIVLVLGLVLAVFLSFRNRKVS